MALTVYFSGTGNSAYVAELFAHQVGGMCLSIEDEADFATEFAAADTIAFCYPIYGSRVPLIMRQFAVRHADCLQGKKMVILATQLIFSGDGARVFTDLFPKGHFDVIYAEHFAMPNNVNNFFLLGQTSNRITDKRAKAAQRKVARICSNIGNGIVRRRGFSGFSRFLGAMQGRPWQGNSRNLDVNKGSMEARAKASIKVDADCTVCGLCVAACPMKNLEAASDTIIHNSNCTICYRCVNLCPHQAITVFFHKKPKWQYKGIPKNN